MFILKLITSPILKYSISTGWVLSSYKIPLSILFQIMSIKRIILDEMSYFGAGSRAVLADEIIKRSFKKVFVVTDNDLVKFGVAVQVTSVLGKAGIPCYLGVL